MSKKLFVGSLSWDTNDDGLRAAFGTHGEVSEAVVISDRDTGRSRGFGFVTFEDDEAADKAVAASDIEWGLVIDMGCEPQDLQRFLAERLVSPVEASRESPRVGGQYLQIRILLYGSIYEVRKALFDTDYCRQQVRDTVDCAGIN